MKRKQKNQGISPGKGVTSLLEQAKHHLSKRDVVKARPYIEQALKNAPDDINVRFLLGTCEYYDRQFESSIEVLTEVTEENPDFADAHLNLGSALSETGRIEEALAHYQRVYELRPGDYNALNNIGSMYKRLNRLDEAQDIFEQCISRNANHWIAYYNLGIIHAARKNFSLAIKNYKSALNLHKDPNIYLSLLGCLKLTKADEAYELAAEILELENPGAALLPVYAMFVDLCEWERAAQIQEHALSIANDLTVPNSYSANILLATNKVEGINRQDIFNAHRVWAEQNARYSTPFSDFIIDFSQDKRIKIGYLSADFREHSVGYFIQHILSSHDPDRFSIHCYSNGDTEDDLTRVIKQSGNIDFIDVHAMSDEELATRIHDDGIHILIDLSGHTLESRCAVMRYRPAPVQMTWLGYPNTTGLDTVDYRISDSHAESTDGTLYTETLLYMPESFLCFGQFDERPIEKELPSLRNGHITFGSFNNVSKLTQHTIRVWSAILSRVPDSVIIIKSGNADRDIVKRNILDEFSKHGINKDRIKLYGFLKDKHAHLDLYNQIDIALDTFPYNGTTTTCQALWMGVPVITLEGQLHAQRVSSAILKNTGIEDTITHTDDQYIEKAVSLAQDVEQRRQLHTRIPGAIRGSILCDPVIFTQQLEHLYLEAWEEKGFELPIKAENSVLSEIAVQLINEAQENINAGNLTVAEEKLDALPVGSSDHPVVAFLFGTIEYTRRNFDKSIALLDKAVRGNPHLTNAHLNLGAALYEVGQLDEALTQYEHVLAVEPENYMALNNIGNVLKKQGQFEEARHKFRESIEANPEYLIASLNLGSTLLLQRDYDNAIGCFTDILSIQGDPAVYALLITALENKGDCQQAYEKAKEAISLPKPGISLLPACTVFSDMCDWERQQAILDRMLTLVQSTPVENTLLQAILLGLNRVSNINSDGVYQLHKLWGLQTEQHCSPYNDYEQAYSDSKHLKIGYLSPDFRQHSVGLFIHNILSSHDKTKFEVYCYSNTLAEDELSSRIRESVHSFVDSRDLTDGSLAQKIHDDGIHILIDLAGHTTGSRIAVMAYRPAPVQMTWLGYPNTTGLESIDYRITDSYAESGDMHYTEKLLILPESFLCFGSFDERPITKISPASKNGLITFGSFNNISKITPQVISTWSEILTKVPDAILMIKSERTEHQLVQENILNEFAKHGIGENRIIFKQFITNNGDHLDTYNNIDIALDTFPYNGTTTTCEALWMGVPVITLVGNAHAQRVSYSILKNIGVEETIADSEAAYIDAAVTLANNTSALEELRKRIPGKLRSSILCNSTRFTHQLEQVYQQAWAEKTPGLHAEEQVPTLTLRRIKTGELTLNPGFFAGLARDYDASVFIETGTFKGDTTAQASIIFEQVHTIELSKKLYKAAVKRFEHTDNVHVHHGDSAIVLPKLLPPIKRKILFWLDGHYSGGGTAQGSKNTPVIEELAAIKKAGITEAVILIDDLRCFNPRNPDVNKGLAGYPTIKQIQQAVMAINENATFVVYGDIALAICSDQKVPVSRLLEACTLSRAFEVGIDDANEVLQAEVEIAQAKGEEKEAIIALCNDYLVSEQHGLGEHYRLWRGLVYSHSGKLKEACADLARALEMGMNHWRVGWYLAQAHARSGSVNEALGLLAQIRNVAPDFKPAMELMESLQASSGTTAISKTIPGNDPTGENFVIANIIKEGQVIFDVGANVGKWSCAALKHCSDIQLHAFEPVPVVGKTLKKNLEQWIDKGNIKVNTIGVSDLEKLQTFYHYKDSPTWSTFYRRHDIEKEYKLSAPEEIEIHTKTIDDYCREKNIRRIDFLKVDVEGGELDVLRGASCLLGRGSIDYIQFEYGGTFKDAGITLKEVYAYLRSHRYEIFRIHPGQLEHIPDFSSVFENFSYCNYLAVNERFRSSLLGLPPGMLDIACLCRQHNVKPRGVIHIGAHEGKELGAYRALGIRKVLFIEANPEVFAKLQANIGSEPGVLAVNYAISNQNGPVELHVTSMDQSSSLLPLEQHLAIYPDIKEEKTVTVEGVTLDSLLDKLNISSDEFNLLNIDIQGAELMALQGATKTLKHIEAINTEINYEELYKGCALIEQMDDFLDAQGLTRVATTTPYHPSWGDAFYIKKPVISMTTLGKNGRFANQIFQYAFLRTYAREFNRNIETPEWIGQSLFGHDDSPITKQRPEVRQNTYKLDEDIIPNEARPFANVDFWGYFQYYTRYYRPYKTYFQSLFKPVKAVEKRITKGLKKLRKKGKTIVGLHLRRGDYGYGHFFIAPNEWYLTWLASIWETLEDPVLFIASDEPEKVIDDFAVYKPVTSGDLGVELTEAPYYPDFYLLSHCDVTAISNSSFSFAACMLNESGKIFYRPHLPTKKLIEFDPWSSETIFRDAKVEDEPVVPSKEILSDWPRWLPEGGEFEALLDEFLVLFQKRPIQDNEGGVKSIGAFSLWYFLKTIKPDLVVESGVWRGFTTWLIESTVPEAQIICLDPMPEVRVYTSRNAMYPSKDFSNMDFSRYDLSSALVFFDDHQDAVARTLQAHAKGFRHLVFDDNYPPEITTAHLTLQGCLSTDNNQKRQLDKIIKEYWLFPPMCQYDKPVTAEKVPIKQAALSIPDKTEYDIFRQEMSTYRWMAYVELAEDIVTTQEASVIPVITTSYPTSQDISGFENSVELDLPSINVLSCFLSSRESYRPLMFSTNEVFSGPDCQTSWSGDEVRTIATPSGIYDIATVTKQLSASQKPELVIVKADATGRNLPSNLDVLDCPKVLVLGNTQHLSRPVQGMLEYARKEQFDFIISDHKRHHLHYFKEAGFNNVYWLPGLNVYPHRQIPGNIIHDVSFVGQAGKWHPYRKHVLDYLTRNGVNINQCQAPHIDAARIYAESLINLNCSLNGDMNLRVFEVLSSGGFLLTDRLSPQAGLDLLFNEDKHLACYNDEKDLKDKIEYYITHPDEARRIAEEGYQEYATHHRPERKMRELMDIVFNNKINPAYETEKDKRSVYINSNSDEALNNRIALYEYFQERHLNTPHMDVLFSSNADQKLLCDVADLPRINLCIAGNGSISGDNSLVSKTGIKPQIGFISADELKKDGMTWDLVVMTPDELCGDAIDRALSSINFHDLMLIDKQYSCNQSTMNEISKVLSERGLVRSPEDPRIYTWQDRVLWAESLASRGLTIEAIKCFQNILRDDPVNIRVLNNLGVISYQLEDLDSAEHFLHQSVSLDRRDPISVINLAEVYRSKEQYGSATTLYEQAVKLDNQNTAAWNNLAFCRLQQENRAGALQAYQHSSRIDNTQEDVCTVIDEIKRMNGISIDDKRLLEPKRILVINNLFPPQELGGYGRLLADFTSILQKRGHTMRVMTSDTRYLGDVPDNELDIDRSLELYGGWEGGKVHQQEPAVVQEIMGRNLDRLRKTIADFKPELCLFGNIDFLGQQMFSPLFEHHIPVIHHLGNKHPGYTVEDTPKDTCYRVATASNWLKHKVMEQGYPLKDVDVIYPGAFVHEYKMPVLPSLDKLRIAYASLIMPYKGIHILIGALEILHQRGIDFECTIAGGSTDHQFLDNMKAYVDHVGMSTKVKFSGFLEREALKDLFARNNVLVFPSVFEEPFGISQVEAMASGLTVVSSGTGGAGEIIENDVSGIIFKTENEISLATELMKLTEDKERWQRIAAEGQRRALEYFDIEVSVDQLEERFKDQLLNH